tara:strand:- start:1203 stop:2129 length:927 start_codon:yes stop_codon:yes gene_type:complete
MIVPYVLEYGNNFRIIDKPDSRKQHKIPIVRIGGLGIFIGFIFCSLSAYFLVFKSVLVESQANIFILICIASLFFFIIGFLDDLFKLSPLFRLVSEIAISLIAWEQGLRISVIDINLLGDISFTYSLPTLLSILLTTIWLVGVTNAINWIDGLDGLAIGVTISSAIGIVFISLNFYQYGSAFFATGIAASALGFLKYNKYPAKILMGDGGSYFLGFSLASLSISGATNSLGITSIDLSFLTLAIPVLDMTFVIFRRLCEGNAPFLPDRKHIHHRLLDRGLSHPKTVIAINLFNILLVCLAIFLSYNIY